MTNPAAYQGSALGSTTPVARRRLDALETACDAQTRAAIERLGPRPHWRALEIGAGAGSIALWLAQVLTQGEVVATDLDTGFLPTDRARMRVLRHDVTADSFPPESFDLIHARAVFEHLPDQRAALTRTLSWLRPGGWIIIEGLDAFPGHSSPHPPLSKAMHAMTRAVTRTLGTDFGFERTLPPLLADAGMTDIGLDLKALVAGDGGPAEAVLRLTLGQLHALLTDLGLLSADDIEALLTWLDTPGTLDVFAAEITVWARKPPAGEPTTPQPTRSTADTPRTPP